MLRFTPAIVLSLVTLIVPPALASKYNFRVYNSSNYTIRYLYVSPSSSRIWQSDILGNSVLRSGDNTRIIFGDPSSRRCWYDFRAVFSDGSVAQNMQVNVCNSDWIEYR